MKVSCKKEDPPLGGLFALELYRSKSKNIELVWGSEALATLPNAKKPISYGNSVDLIRILWRQFESETDPLVKTTINHWLTFSLTLENEIPKSLEYLDESLVPLTYLVGECLSVADLAVYSSIYVSQQYKAITKENKFKNIERWMKLIGNHNTVVNTLKSIPSDVKSSLEKVSNTPRAGTVKNGEAKEVKQEGKFIDLPNAEMGKVVVRFPPEASGYLHIGHAKAALLNQYYQEAFKGKFIMRFDDTNPAKENVDFEKVILEDVEMLEIKPDMFTHTSQYFDLMLEMCEKLIKESKAYVDDTPAEQMKIEREQKVESANRSNSPEKNLSMWLEMKKASDVGIKCCVRAKIDMQSQNGCMRDPTIYRCKPESHPRTGNQYNVYPTYDFACPIVDSIEGVTHVLRTMEYHDRDPQFEWFIAALGLRLPTIWEYSRLNMTNTVLSKRKLTWFVEQGLVDGWDDPRMPTVRGVLRRGMTVEGLRQFIRAQGSSRSVVVMEWDKIWAINKKVIDPIASRFVALENDAVPVNLKGQTNSTLTVALHPKNPDYGTKEVLIGPTVFIDRKDIDLLVVGQNATFINYGNVVIDEIVRKDGVVTCVNATPNLENKDYKKTPKLTWIAQHDIHVPVYCVYFDHIISKPILGKDEDFKNYIGHNTRTEVPMFGESALKGMKHGEVIQLQRIGFFRVDVPYKEERSPHTGRVQPLILFQVPDGKEQSNAPTKSASTQKSEPKQSSTVTAGSGDSKVADVLKAIAAQGDKVRQLKSQKADKAALDAEVKKLLSLKADYKSASGKDWTPDAKPPSSSNDVTNKSANDVSAILDSIKAQGDRVRDLKAAKADKATLDTEVKKLLAFKAEYKSATGKDWTPDAKAPSSSGDVTAKATNDVSGILNAIKAQGDRVRDLKAAKADKGSLDAEVKKLLALKSDYKAATGKDWTPNATASTPTTASSITKSNQEDPTAILEAIKTQGDKIRELKSKKADKASIDAEVKKLLDLKSDYKKVTGEDWTPNSKPPTVKEVAPKSDDLNARINEQGNKVRSLKENKADKAAVQAEVQVLLALKTEFKQKTGKDWSPNMAPTAAQVVTTSDAEGLRLEIERQTKALEALKLQYEKMIGQNKPQKEEVTSSSGSSKKDELAAKIVKQGDIVRDLKSKKAEKSAVDLEVKKLLELKAEFEKETGAAYVPPAAPKPSKEPSKEKASKPSKDKPAKDKKESEQNKSKEASSTGVKKITRLGIEASKDTDLAEWYSQVITKGEMIEYYDISGCYILRPWSFSIWEVIRDFLRAEFAKLGVKECYFPIFVSKAALEREKDHIADFAPEVAWVTHSGSSELAEHIAVRPTSETVMYPAYAKWIQSHRDLPIKLNQWNNVVRWEFKQPQPFIRTREFLWQEGHTAFLSKEEADIEVLQILDLYARVYEEFLAIPVVKGRKSEKEKFAGGDYTTTVEAYVPASGRGIQGATSHHLGQNFSKMFEIIYDDPETQEKKYVFQNSWGLTTRTIGVMVLVHGDERGLVLPPRVASLQAVIVPCGISATTPTENLVTSCKELEAELSAAGVRVSTDGRDNYSPGWKFNHWELKGVPIRLELGPKDLAAGTVVAALRFNGEKRTLQRKNIVADIKAMLDEIHQKMFEKALLEKQSRTTLAFSWEQFQQGLDNKHILLAPYCGDIPCEDNIKNDSARVDEDAAGGPAMGAKTLCIPFVQPNNILPNDKCIHPKCTKKPKYYALFGRSY